VKTVLLTGATGHVGSWHVQSLVNRGHKVTCLVRGEDPRARLGEFMPQDVVGQVGLLSGDILKPLGGVSSADIEALRGKFDAFVHHAGNVKFDQQFADEIIAANAGGTAHMLSLASELGVPTFHYNSTAYASRENPRNPYEESKAAAELLVRQWNGEWTIWKESVVVGHSETGETQSFTGYYGWFSGFAYLKHLLRKTWDADQSSCRGFHFEGNVLVLDEPIFLDYSTTSTLNLVPVDWLVEAMTDIMEGGETGREYFLADPNPPRVEEVIEQSFDILGIKGVKRREGTFFAVVSDPLIAEFQRRMDERLGIYIPYVTEELPFGCDAINGRPPKVNREFLATMLEYAANVRFGHLATAEA